jgi:hypothetical protein
MILWFFDIQVEKTRPRDREQGAMLAIAPPAEPIKPIRGQRILY